VSTGRGPSGGAGPLAAASRGGRAGAGAVESVVPRALHPPLPHGRTKALRAAAPRRCCLRQPPSVVVVGKPRLGRRSRPAGCSNMLRVASPSKELWILLRCLGQPAPLSMRASVDQHLRRESAQTTSRKDANRPTTACSRGPERRRFPSNTIHGLCLW